MIKSWTALLAFAIVCVIMLFLFRSPSKHSVLTTLPTRSAVFRCLSGHHHNNHHQSDHHHQSHHGKHDHHEVHNAHLDRDDSTLIRHQAITLLKQKISVMKMLSDEDFTKKNPNIYNGSVGSHIRHSLDHFRAIIRACQDDNAIADYDTRQRNTEEETNRHKAIDAVEKVIGTIHLMDLSKGIKVSFIGDEKAFRTYTIESHVGRELSFASHHAVHHMSMVKLLMQGMSYDFSKDSPIGIALSTAKDMKGKNEL